MLYRDDHFALFADLRNPYITLGYHIEWDKQFQACIHSAKVHSILSGKLRKIEPFILIYSKIWPNLKEIKEIAGFDKPSICVISSCGEHAITPWMIIHNIAHSYLSWFQHVKTAIKNILGVDPNHYSLAPKQAHLVKSAASKRGLIPNLSEIIYELFTTWVWYGTTKSGNKEIADYCDIAFKSIIDSTRDKMIWHKFRPPAEMVKTNVSLLADLIR